MPKPLPLRNKIQSDSQSVSESVSESVSQFFFLIDLRHGCLATQGFYNPRGAQPFMRWTGQLNGLYYAMGDVTMNYCEARHLCAQQPGNSHLALLDQQDDFDAVPNFLANHYQSVLPVQFWLDATRPSGGCSKFRLPWREVDNVKPFFILHFLEAYIPPPPSPWVLFPPAALFHFSC